MSYKFYALKRNHGEYAVIAFLRDDKSCMKCGKKWKKANRLGLHHINWDETDDSFRNLVTLCAKCHRAIHSHTKLTYTPPLMYIETAFRKWIENFPYY